MNKIRLKKKQKLMIEALIKSLGNITIACESVGIGRTTHYLWLKENPKYKKEVEETEERTLDFFENALFKQAKAGNMTAIIFYLKTKGKKRGYIERTEQSIEHKNGIKFIIEDETNKVDTKPQAKESMESSK